MDQHLYEIKQWLTDFAHCVRTQDFESGRSMFCKDIYCFGSKADILIGIDDLVQRQWKEIWPNISGFRFLMDQFHCEMNQEKNLACILVPWVSTGYTSDGTAYHRPGRVTIILIYDPHQQSWLAKHTHYSLFHGTPTETIRPAPHAPCKSII